eukprot:3843017-Amphidinium_carterae.2
MICIAITKSKDKGLNGTCMTTTQQRTARSCPKVIKRRGMLGEHVHCAWESATGACRRDGPQSHVGC